MYHFSFTLKVFAVLSVGYQSIPASQAQSHTELCTVHRGHQEKRCVERSHFQVERLPEENIKICLSNPQQFIIVSGWWSRNKQTCMEHSITDTTTTASSTVTISLNISLAWAETHREMSINSDEMSIRYYAAWEHLTLSEAAETLQHADGRPGGVTAVAPSLQLIVAAQDGVCFLCYTRLKSLDQAEIGPHLLHTP